MQIQDLTKINRSEENRTISPENMTGEKGKAAMTGSDLGPERKGHAAISLKQGETVTVADIHDAGEIRHIWMTIADATPAGSFVLRDVVLRMYWDDSETPAVEAPIGDFFFNGFAQRQEIDSALINVNPVGGFNSYFPMPFKKHAVITITNEHPADVPDFFYTINYVVKEQPEEIAYFHAYWNREDYTKKQQDYTILPTIHGAGHYIGTYFELAALQRYWWGEGEFKFYIDGDGQYPTVTSTGSEDYFGGAWAFHVEDDGQIHAQTFQHQYLGYPLMDRYDHTRENFSTGDAMPLHGFGNDSLPMHALYRLHLPDPIFFKDDLTVKVQQIGNDDIKLFERSDDIASVAYWYQDVPTSELPTILSRDERVPR
ncbi:glycoside hydrolase family 172 protein [Weissella bombi]|uniref:DUF2961 domain-containing protein n=1 Tax=Weissella bombi TaxID=1505725 RepID=A0A1C3YZX9_9LACO|nr:glycoside hydrolase family 172 protein [Weissella bombi]SCB75629.1 Protein of unknown function [Weissella bombi]